MSESTQTKVCCRCSLPKELSEFGINRSAKDGRMYQCRACLSAAAKSRTPKQREASRRANAAFMARWRAEHPEESKAQQRKYKAEHPERVKMYRQRFKAKNPEKVREWNRRSREARKDELAVYFAEYYALHADKVKARSRAWRLANPEQYRELKQRRRARLKGATVQAIDVAALWTGHCGICLEDIDPSLRRPDPMSRSIDHIIPLSKGGEHGQSNLQWTHLVCNLRKGAKVLPEVSG